MKVSEVLIESNAKFIKASKKKGTTNKRKLAADKKKQAQILAWRQGPVYKALTAPEPKSD